jgi:hypothetical protein
MNQTEQLSVDFALSQGQCSRNFMGQRPASLDRPSQVEARRGLTEKKSEFLQLQMKGVTP